MAYLKEIYKQITPKALKLRIDGRVAPLENCIYVVKEGAAVEEPVVDSLTGKSLLLAPGQQWYYKDSKWCLTAKSMLTYEDGILSLN